MKKFFALVIAAAISFGAQAQQLKVATGSLKGTYSQMFKEITATCGSNLALIEQNTTGSIDNMNMIVGNQVNAGFVQTDILFYRAQNEDLSNIKTLLALHPEQVHIVAMNKTFKTGGTLGFGGKEFTLNQISDLAGRRVGAAGGSVVTAQIIRLQAEINYQVQEFASTSEALKALAAGTVDAVVAVGGQPLGDISNLGPQYKMLMISDSVVKKLERVYRPAKLNYSKMNARGVQTVATDALFVTREYKTAKMVDGLTKLRSCVASHLDDLKETTGTHPAWQYVNADTKAKWPMYELKK